MTATGIPKNTALRALEDLALLRLVDMGKTGDHDNSAWSWSPSEEASIAWPR
jgi:hypothetical protein